MSTPKVVMITPRGLRAFEQLDDGAQVLVQEAFGRMRDSGLFGGRRLRDVDGKAAYAVRAGRRQVLVVEEPEALMVVDIVAEPTSGGPARVDDDRDSGGPGRLDGKKASGF